MFTKKNFPTFNYTKLKNGEKEFFSFDSSSFSLINIVLTELLEHSCMVSEERNNKEKGYSKLFCSSFSPFSVTP